AQPQAVFTVKEEVISKASSEQGEEEMEVESADEKDEEAKAQGGQQSKGRNIGTSFNTLSSLTTLKPGLNANMKRYEQIREDLAASESSIQQLEGSSNDNADRYKFLQEMRGYVGDLLECFSEKVRENLSAV
ncbi:hypothetical protein GOODEAATRI_005472, partial [Goodea atripinnis]